MQARLRGNAAVASDTLRRGQKSRGTDLTNRVAAERKLRRALRRLRPPEGASIFHQSRRPEHLALSMNARYKAPSSANNASHFPVATLRLGTIVSRGLRFWSRSALPPHRAIHS